MKKNKGMTLFILVNVLFIFLQVYNHTRSVQETYRKQKNEKQHALYCQKKANLSQQLYALKNAKTIKTFARNTLKMHQIKLHQIKKINENYDEYL